MSCDCVKEEVVIISVIMNQKRFMLTPALLWLCMALFGVANAALRSRTGAEPHSQVLSANIDPRIKQKLLEGKRLGIRDRGKVRKAEKEKYLELRRQGVDEVSNTAEAAALRAYKLRSKKRKGLVRKRQATLADVLFPGVAPVEYRPNESVDILVDLVESKKTPIPFEYYDLPFCARVEDTSARQRRNERKNLGSRLQGHDLQSAPYRSIRVTQDQGCTPLCLQHIDRKSLRWLRQLVERQYRAQLVLDQLPVLMRSKEYNYAVRGFPLGFQAPSSFEKPGEYYLFNHLRFIITYHEDPTQFEGVRITGFDVHPVSVQHALPKDGSQVFEGSSNIATCQSTMSVDNDASSYLLLRAEQNAPTLPIVYSYQVEWVESELAWSDRWDVYLVGSPDDDLHYLSIVNSLAIVIFLTGAISTILIRTLRKDISMYNEMDSLDDGEETGWKLVHGDVFRPPQTMPMALSVLVGTGAQIGVAFGLAMLCSVLKLLNPLQKGQTLTALIILYVLSGSVAGYVSARIYKYTDQKQWKLNVILTATALPGCLVCIFVVLNIFLSFAGAATAVSFFTIVKLFLLWVCVSTPLVFIGGFFGLKSKQIEVPTKTNQIARVVPPLPWHSQAKVTCLMGGILPFGSVCIELAFIMSALWLHQIYYAMGFLLVVLLILGATCAQVSIVLCYLQLCSENHRWWWPSFFNCASSGLYLVLYSIWFLSSRLDMVGLLPVVVYLTYMTMISFCFALFCGATGFLASFAFVRAIYGAVKVD